MKYLIGILIIIICVLVIYIALIQWQLHSISKQLSERLIENRRQPICLQLINRKLNQLTDNINKCLKAEETLRLNSVQEEKKFKELIANISHDLRTPLTAIKGYLQLMEIGELSAEQQKKLKIAKKHSDKLGNLIEHFFEYSYLINAEPKLNIERINLTNFIVESLAASVTSFEERGLSVHFEQTEPVFVMVDQEMTLRIIQNLIRNTVTHSVSDVTIELSNDARLVFKNKVDNPAEIDVNRLFDRFYTNDKARSKTTGLGLSIIKILAEQMGGNVNASLVGNEIAIQVKFPLQVS